MRRGERFGGGPPRRGRSGWNGSVAPPESLDFKQGSPKFGNGPNTVSESTVSSTELSEFFLPPLSSGENSWAF